MPPGGLDQCSAQRPKKGREGWLRGQQRALQPAAEPRDVVPGWVSKPPSRGPLPAPFGMCERLVTPSSLLTRRACMSPNHEVMWRVAMPILLSSEPAGFPGGSSYLSPCPPVPRCACDKPGSYSLSVLLLVLIPPENAGFTLSAPLPQHA